MKYREIKEVRDQMVASNPKCQLCGREFTASQPPVLDHNHSSGLVRGAIHRGCNSLLGKVENNYKRYGVISVLDFLSGAKEYLEHHESNPSTLVHPTSTRTKKPKKRRTPKP